MADLKQLAEQIVGLTLLEAQELKTILKDEYGIEPAAGGAVMMAGPAAGGAAEAAEEKTEFSYAYLGFQADGSAPAPGRWGEGPSIDGKGTFATGKLQPSDQKPDLGMARPGSGAQAEQIG